MSLTKVIKAASTLDAYILKRKSNKNLPVSEIESAAAEYFASVAGVILNALTFSFSAGTTFFSGPECSDYRFESDTLPDVAYKLFHSNCQLLLGVDISKFLDSLFKMKDSETSTYVTIHVKAVPQKTDDLSSAQNFIRNAYNEAVTAYEENSSKRDFTKALTSEIEMLDQVNLAELEVEDEPDPDPDIDFVGRVQTHHKRSIH